MLSERSDKWQNNEKMKAVPACFAFSSATRVPILARPLNHKDQHVHKQNSSCTVIKKIYQIYHACLKHQRKPVRYGKDGAMGKHRNIIHLYGLTFSAEQDIFFPHK